MAAALRRNGRFHAALKRAMKDGGWTRTALAERLEVGRATVYGWLAGAEPSDENFERLVALFPTLKEFRR